MLGFVVGWVRASALRPGVEGVWFTAKHDKKGAWLSGGGGSADGRADGPGPSPNTGATPRTRTPPARRCGNAPPRSPVDLCTVPAQNVAEPNPTGRAHDATAPEQRERVRDTAARGVSAWGRTKNMYTARSCNIVPIPSPYAVCTQ